MPRPADEGKAKARRSDGAPIYKNAAIDELAQLDQWVLWKRGPKPGKRGKFDKIPYRVGGQEKASSTDAATWNTFDAFTKVH